MDILTQRDGPNNNALLEQRFIQRILSEEATNIKDAQSKIMASRGFSTANFYSGRSFAVNDTVLAFQHLQKHRFVDMKSRLTKAGTPKPKISYPIHNRTLYGHANNIVRRLSFEFTDGMKKMLLNEHNGNL